VSSVTDRVVIYPDDGDDDEDDDNNLIWPTWAVGQVALFRRARRIHINCVCFHIYNIYILMST
jgi:hypothetical protein